MGVVKTAQSVTAGSGVPVLLLLSIGVHESGWFKFPSGKNNYVGMKFRKRHKSFTVRGTHEVVSGQNTSVRVGFADYDSLEECFRDVVWLFRVNSGYRGAIDRWNASGKSWSDWVRLTGEIGAKYATDPKWALGVQRATLSIIRKGKERHG